VQEDVRRALLERLIDHAALFPPASMSMEDALAEDRAARESPYAWMLDRFVCPASRLSSLDGLDAPVSVVLDESLSTPAAAVELRPGDAPDLAGTVRRLRELSAEVYVELPPEALRGAVDEIAAAGGRFKLRCGGEVVPSVEQVAQVLVTCSEAGIVMKATAGLHHPLRRGAEHGFLNLLCAAVLARARSAPAAELWPTLRAKMLEELPLSSLTADEVRSTRASLFKGFGSCSWREPVDDLRGLGVLS
jgi:hypothetical protein